MAASQPANFNLQEFTDVGQLLVGGRLYTYAYGTTAQKTAFTDPDGTVPHTYTADGAGGQYIALNARGELPAPLYLGDGSYDIALKRADGSTVWTRKADGVENSIRSWIATVAAAIGASLIGFIQAGVGAIKRTLLDKVREIQVSITDYGATTGNTSAQNDPCIQVAIDAVYNAGGGVVTVPPGTFLFGTLTPRSNVTIAGSGTLKQVQPVANVQTGIRKAAGAGSLSNFHIRGISLDGDRQANPGNQYNAIVSIELAAGETLDNFSVTECAMQDAQDHFVRLIATGSTALATRITVRRNSFITTPAKRSLGGTSDAVAYDAVRLEQTWDYASAGNGYGTVNFKQVVITDNYAESVRTLADIKRGCSHFLIRNNRTKNMFDCHHSVDGSFHGEVIDNVCEVESTYAGPSTYTNFIECQGEHIRIAGNVCSGGGKVINGILVSDYGRVEEGGKGHRSRHVTIESNRIKDITNHAVRTINGECCAILNNHLENVGGHVATIESGTGQNDPTTGLPNVASGCRVSGNSSKNATLGVSIRGANHVKGINPDENGQDYLYCPGLALADTYANFINEGGYHNMNPNSLMELNGVAANNVMWTDADFYPAATAAATRPNNAANAVTLSDESAAVIRTIYCATHPAVSQGHRIYARVEMKKNTATNYGILVQEYDAAGTFLSNTFYGTNVAAAAWTAYIIGHKVTNANAAYVRIGIMPGSSANDPPTTGSADVANFRIARVAIGR